MWFTSDNAAGAAPEVMAALSAVNEGPAMAYGADAATARAADAIREAFEAPGATVHFVATGTAANAVSLACLCPPWGAVYCHELSHIECDECGAPEFFTGGAKLVHVAGDHARMDAAALAAAIAGTAHAGVHNVQKGALSLTQATETGTVYGVEEIRRLAAGAREAGVPVHMDGTRFANALVATNASPAEMSWKAGVDALCLGATKNGALAAEAVILFDEEKAWEFELRRKRGGHLVSKMRFVAAQFEAMMAGGLWLRLAAHANAMAAKLAEGIAAIPGAELAHPVEANLVFARLPRAVHDAAAARGARYHLWPGADGRAPTGRLVCSWETREADVAALLDAFRSG